MIFTSKSNGEINNLVGICRNYNIGEPVIRNIKSHSFDDKMICTKCSINIYHIRRYIRSFIEYGNKDFTEILNCNETAIKRLLE